MIDNIVADHLLLSDYRLECWLLRYSQKSCDGSGGGGSRYSGSQKSMLRDRVTWDIPNVANNASPHIRKMQTQSVKANFLRTQSVKANVIRTTRAPASAFWTRSVRAFAIRT